MGEATSSLGFFRAHESVDRLLLLLTRPLLLLRRSDGDGEWAERADECSVFGIVRSLWLGDAAGWDAVLCGPLLTSLAATTARLFG